MKYKWEIIAKRTYGPGGSHYQIFKGQKYLIAQAIPPNIKDGEWYYDVICENSIAKRFPEYLMNFLFQEEK